MTKGSPTLPYAIGEFSFSESRDILGVGGCTLPSSLNADGSQVCPSY